MRKYSLFLILFFMNSAVGNAQVTDCSAFKKGQFMYSDSLNDIVKVTRRNKKQYEFNTRTRVNTVLKIRWNSSCEYELEQVWTDSRSLRKNKGAKTKVIITAILASGYKYTTVCACNEPNTPSTERIMKKVYNNASE